MNQFLQEVVQINFLPLLITGFLFFFLHINKAYEKNIRKKIIPCLILLVILMVTDNVDYYAYDKNILGLLHRMSAMVGYDVRLFIQALLTSIAMSRQTTDKKKLRLVFLPAIINVILILPCLFSDIVFYYKEDGSIGRGALAFTPHIISLLYVLFLLYLAVICAVKYFRKDEAFLLSLCGLISILGVLVELIFQLRGILIGVIALDITFYYLYLHLEHFKYDNLTKFLNREAFYADIKHYGREKINYIMSIDINNLKVENDTRGHDAGDILIKTVADGIRASLTKECYPYRVGGDEFAVLCFERDYNRVKKIIDTIYDIMKKTNCSVAVGYTLWKENETFEEAYKRSDNLMYDTKRKMKKEAQNKDKEQRL